MIHIFHGILVEYVYSQKTFIIKEKEVGSPFGYNIIRLPYIPFTQVKFNPFTVNYISFSKLNYFNEDRIVEDNKKESWHSRKSLSKIIIVRAPM